MFDLDQAAAPLCLALRTGHEPDHWQAHWERRRSDVRRIVLDEAVPLAGPAAVARLGLAVRAAGAPVLLVAHGETCRLVARWAAGAGETAAGRIAGAMLVMPSPVCDARDRQVLPFPAVVVASRRDPTLPFAMARDLAADWLASLCESGTLGPAGLGAWPEGETVLDRLIAHATQREHRWRDDRVVRERPEAIMPVPA